jgi:hypothetical protein
MKYQDTLHRILTDKARRLWAAACKLDGYDPDDLYIRLRPGNQYVREMDRIILEGAKLGYRIRVR